MSPCLALYCLSLWLQAKLTTTTRGFKLPALLSPLIARNTETLLPCRRLGLTPEHVPKLLAPDLPSRLATLPLEGVVLLCAVLHGQSQHLCHEAVLRLQRQRFVVIVYGILYPVLQQR